MQFAVSFELYIDIVSSYIIPNIKACSVYHWNQNRNKAENKLISLQWRYLFIYLCLFIFGYRALFVCVKDKTGLRSKNSNSILLPIFGILFFFSEIWQSMRNFYMYNLKCGDISSYGQRTNINFSWKLYSGLVWFFLDNYLYMRPENLKSLKI